MNEANCKAMMHKTVTIYYFQDRAGSIQGTQDISKWMLFIFIIL